MIVRASLEPTSLRTVKPSEARWRTRSHFWPGSIVIVPSETSTWSMRSSRSHLTSPSTRPWVMASSVSVPPRTTGMPCARRRSSLGSRLPVASAVPPPSLTMSTLAPATSTSPSTWASESPRSRTWVRPVVRGLPLRGGGWRTPATPLMGEILADEDHDLRPAGGRRVHLVDRDDLLGADLPGHRARGVLLTGGELDLAGLLGLVGGVGDGADREAALAALVGHRAREPGHRRAVEHGDRGRALLRGRQTAGGGLARRRRRGLLGGRCSDLVLLGRVGVVAAGEGAGDDGDDDPDDEHSGPDGQQRAEPEAAGPAVVRGGGPAADRAARGRQRGRGRGRRAQRLGRGARGNGGRRRQRVVGGRAGAGAGGRDQRGGGRLGDGRLGRLGLCRRRDGLFPIGLGLCGLLSLGLGGL